MGEPQLTVRVGRDVATVTPWVREEHLRPWCMVRVRRHGTTWDAVGLVGHDTLAPSPVPLRFLHRGDIVEMFLFPWERRRGWLCQEIRNPAAREAVRQMREAHSSPEGEL